MTQTEKTGSENLTPHQRLKRLLSYEKQDIWVIVIYGICSGLFALVVPVAVQTLVNTIAFGSMLQPILVLTLVVLFILGFSALMRGLQVFLMEIVQQRIFARTSLRLSERIPRMRIQAFEGHHGPELINRFFDILTVQKSTALIVIDGLSVLLQTFLGMILLAFYHPILLAFDLLLVGMIFGVVFVLGKGSIQTSIQESKKKYLVAGWLEELARLPILFKNPQNRGFVLNHSDNLTSYYLKSRKAHFKILMRQIIGALSLQVLASSLLLGLGGWLVVKRQLTLGQLVAAELVVTSVVTGVGKFGKYLESYYDLVAAADKLGYILELPTERKNKIQIDLPVSSRFSPYLILTDLCYSYPNQEPCLKRVHLQVQEGEKISILGNRGSGKSTLCDLIYGLRDPKSGLIELQGIASKDHALDQYRSQMSFLRGIDLFEGTLFENLKIHNAELQIHQIYDALERLGILKEIQHLPNGLSTEISGGRSPLSSNQAKLVTLARALLSNPKLIILDCFFDDLDDESRILAIKSLFESPQLTVILATGSKEIAKAMQNFWKLEQGVLHSGRSTSL